MGENALYLLPSDAKYQEVPGTLREDFREVSFEAAGEYAELLGLSSEDEVCVRDQVMRADGKPV